MKTARNTRIASADLTCIRVERSFRRNGWGDIAVRRLTSTIAHVSDGCCAWFARIGELTEIDQRPVTDGSDCGYVSAEVYAEWCASHKALRITEIPRTAQRAARTWGNRPLVDTF